MDDIEQLRARLRADGWSLVEEEVRELIYHNTARVIGWKVTASRGERRVQVAKGYLSQALTEALETAQYFATLDAMPEAESSLKDKIAWTFKL